MLHHAVKISQWIVDYYACEENEIKLRLEIQKDLGSLEWIPCEEKLGVDRIEMRVQKNIWQYLFDNIDLKTVLKNEKTKKKLIL